MNILKQIASAILKEELDANKRQIDDANKMIGDLHDEINKLTFPNPKEEYYNNKYPKFQQTYYKQLLGKKVSFDVRCFVGNFNNDKLPTFIGTDDEIAIKALEWIIKEKVYASDSKTTGLTEYWNMSYESMIVEKMDCEDGAILLYDILRKHGIKPWRLRLTVGWAVNPFNKNIDGHAYLTYYSEVEDKWVALDWCYFPNLDLMKDRPKYSDIGFYGDVWWSFNEDYCWGVDKIQ